MSQLLRTSERRDFKRCPQRWQWAWNDGLRQPGPPSDALWFGTGWHLVMAHWYSGPGTKRGKAPLKVWREFVDGETRAVRTSTSEEQTYKEESYVDAGKLGEAMLGAYLDLYGKDPTWHVIQPEQTFQVEIPPHFDGDPTILYAGTYDLVFRDLTDDLIWLGEHKTAKAIFTNHLPLDDQGGSYHTVAGTTLRAEGTLKKGERLEGVMYNFARKALPDTRPTNDQGLATNKPTKAHYQAAFDEAGIGWKPKWLVSDLPAVAEEHGLTVLGDASKVQPSPLFLREPVHRTRAEMKTMVNRIKAESVAMERMRDGSLPLFKTPTRDCSWDCSFYNMCLLHEKGDSADWKEFREAVYRIEDPYADHRKSASD